MKLNSQESVRRGRALLKEAGSWDALRANSTRTDDGVYVVKPRRQGGMRPYIGLNSTVERFPDRIEVTSRWDGVSFWEESKATVTLDCPVAPGPLVAEDATDEQIITFLREHLHR